MTTSIMDIARECGAAIYAHRTAPDDKSYGFTESSLIAFADRIRAEERERCAKVCDGIETHHWNDYKGRYIGPHPRPVTRGNPYIEGMSDGASECVAAIRSTNEGTP